MSDVAGAEVITGIEEPLALIIENVRAFAANDDLRIDAWIFLLKAHKVGKEVAQAALSSGPQLLTVINLGGLPLQMIRP
jgi:hypothetical protein